MLKPCYEPKRSLQFKKDLKNSEQKNTNSYSENKSSYLNGGEGKTLHKILAPGAPRRILCK